MITALLLALLGTALVAVLIAMIRAPAGAAGRIPPAPGPAAPVASAPQDNPLELDAWDARVRDVISIRGGADDFSDLDFTLDRRSAYEAKNHRWLELSGDYRGRRIVLEVYRYPQQEILGFLDARTLSIADLGVTEDQLADFDSRQDASALLGFEGKQWRYESSREITYKMNEAAPSGEGLYRWIFIEQGGTRHLCIEKREGEPFDARIARLIEKRDITVYRAA